MKTDLLSVDNTIAVEEAATTSAEQSAVDPNQERSFFKRYRSSFIFFLFALIGLLVLWQYGPLLREIISDRARFQAFVDEVGWFGPIVLIFFNALQIVVAPIPGYAVQLAAGFLYGTWWGGLWGTLGLFLGSMIAMWLARTYGRPLVERVIGSQRLQHWEEIIHSDTLFVWFILLLGPTGDAPFYLAGLSKVRFIHIALITLLIRVPSVFVATAIGAGTVVLTWWQFTLILLFVGLAAFILMHYKESLVARMERLLKKLTQRYTVKQPEQRSIS